MLSDNYLRCDSSGSCMMGDQLSLTADASGNVMMGDNLLGMDGSNGAGIHRPDLYDNLATKMYGVNGAGIHRPDLFDNLATKDNGLGITDYLPGTNVGMQYADNSLVCDASGNCMMKDVLKKSKKTKPDAPAADKKPEAKPTTPAQKPKGKAKNIADQVADEVTQGVSEYKQTKKQAKKNEKHCKPFIIKRQKGSTGFKLTI
jgi:hypothetical protein